MCRGAAAPINNLKALCIPALLTFSLATSLLCSAQTEEQTAAFAQATQAMRAGKLDEAGAGFAAVAKQAPTFAEAHFNLGLVREEQGKYDDAVASFQKALALKPRLHGANLFLGMTQFQVNRLDEALASVKKETAYYPKDALAWMWLGVVYLAKEQPEPAAEALDHAAKLKPGDPDILYHRGRAHLLVSKDSYAEMFKVDPQSWRVHRVLAQAYAEAERHTDAIAEYEAAIKLAPTQPGLNEELGSEYLQVNKIAEAETTFQRELEINPHNLLATYKLGVIAVLRGDGTKAKMFLEEAQREKPGLLHLAYNLGRAKMLLGNEADAVGDFERSVKTDPDPEVVMQAWYQLGTAYRRLRRLDDAQSAIATYQKLKDEAAVKSQKSLENYRMEHPNEEMPAALPTPER
jgi:tetratricopeptide (TPR) repeat protein